MRIGSGRGLTLGLVVLVGCSHELDGPRPDPSGGLDPHLVCNAQITTRVTISGTGFSPLPVDTATLPARLELPRVTLTRSSDLEGSPSSGAAVAIPDSSTDPASSQLRWTSQMSMAMDITPELGLAEGIYDLDVENPNGRRAERRPSALAVVPPPVLESIEPVLVCVAQFDVMLMFSGTGFLDVEGTLPTILLSTDDTERSYTPTEMIGCRPLPAPAEQTRTCTGFVVIVPEGDLPPGIYDALVTNPEPAGCDSRSDTVQVAIVPPPMLTRVEPMAICDAQSDQTLTFTGNGFLSIGGMLPTVTISAGGVEHTYTPTTLTGCMDLPPPAVDAQTCDGLEVLIPEDDLPPGTYTVVVTNPVTAHCRTEEVVTLEVVPPPDVTDVMPRRICTGGGSIGILGTGFRDGATVSAGSLTASTVTVAPGGTMATATFGLGLAPGTYDVTLTNPEGCFDTLTAAVEVVEGPIIFWVDPLAVYNGITTQITIYGSGLASGIDSVQIVPAGGGMPIDLAATLDAPRNRIQAIVPAGTAPGAYDVVVHASDCPAVLPNGLRVTDTLSLTLDRIEPPFGATAANTPVTVFGTGFVNGPRAYLNPQTPTPTTVATPLSSVAFVDPTRLTGVVRSGLPVGVYDLIVVNPTGEVGLLEDAFTVAADPPPIIDTVSPGELDAGSVHTIDVTGSGFRMPSASWSCRALGGASSTPAGSVSASTGTTAAVTLDTTALSAGTVCVLRLTNPDGTYGEYSAVAITTPASNIQMFRPGSEMTTPRRGLGLSAGRATSAARFLYAVGGDSGATAGALATSEAAPVDIFGALGAWFAQPNPLPGPRTLARMQRIGRFLYLVGGSDGSAPQSDVRRAEILDPLSAPIVTDVAARRGMGTGLGGGVWYYRVSAIYPASDTNNPGGESLPSDPLAINLPVGLPDTLILSIFWSEVAGASGYRIYRSPSPDLASGTELLLAEVDAATRDYEDTGTDPMAGRSPLPLGTHGTWAAMPSLATPREALGLGHAVDPADPDVHYLYAIGGRGAGGAPLASVEILSVTVESAHEHTVAPAWVANAASLAEARAELATYSVDHFAAIRVPLPRTFVYAIAGLGAGGATTQTSEVAEVQAGGQLGPWQAVDDARRIAGAAAVAGNDFLYMFGGGPAPGTTCISAEICGAGLSCMSGLADPPDLRNWNSEGISLNVARYLPGGTVESAFVFVAGGVDGSGAALRSTEQTVL